MKNPSPIAIARRKRRLEREAISAQPAGYCPRPLPVDHINICLGTELAPGDLVVPAGMEVHIGRKRPDEYARLLPHLGAVTTSPLYVGDDFKNAGIEIVGSAPGSGGEFILIAICLTLDHKGHYQVRTFYSLTRSKIEQRRAKGFLKLLP